MGAHPTAIDRARAQRDDRVGILRRFDQMVDARLVGDAQRLAVPAFQHRALVDQQIVARLDGLLLGFLHRPACCRRKGLRVVQGDHFQNDRRRIGLVDLSERFGAAGARCALDPDDRVQIAFRRADHGLFECLGDARGGKLGQASGYCHGSAHFHETAAGYPPCLQHCLQLASGGLMFHVHTSL